MDLQGKVALVTGGAIRVGRAIAIGLAEAGADVIVNYNSSADAAAETIRDIEALGRQAIAYQADVAQADRVRAMIDAAIARFGRLDVLVNSASQFRRTPWSELDGDAWDFVTGIILKGSFLCAHYAAPHLAAHGDGLIVNIVDLSAFVPFPNFLPHSAGKAGLLNMTYGLAMELAPAIRVNAVAPGPVLPPPSYSPERTELTAKRTLLGRWGRPEDVAQAVLYLAEADYVTGIVIPVDGGERFGMTRH